MQLRSGTGADAQGIHALLQASDLPTSDLGASAPRFVVACQPAGAIVGTGALEPLGGVALLRSLVVASEHRGRGIGDEIVRELERVARSEGIRNLVLLTLTAKDFFERHGFRVIDRSAVPEAIQATAEFRSLCPASAICMSKALDGW